MLILGEMRFVWNKAVGICWDMDMHVVSGFVFRCFNGMTIQATCMLLGEWVEAAFNPLIFGRPGFQVPCWISQYETLVTVAQFASRRFYLVVTMD